MSFAARVFFRSAVPPKFRVFSRAGAGWETDCPKDNTFPGAMLREARKTNDISSTAALEAPRTSRAAPFARRRALFLFRAFLRARLCG